MKPTFDIAHHGMRLAALALAIAGASSAQMGGGMMGGGSGYGGMMGGSGNSGTIAGGSGYGGMMGGANGMMGGANGMMGGMMGGSLAGMMGAATGLTVAPDGTLYITRSVATQGQGQLPQTATTQLAAIGSDGKSKWTLPIDSSSASQPVLGKDGTLFLTTSDWSNWMYSRIYSRSTAADGITPNLLIVKPGEGSANITTTVPLAGQIASAPQIVADNAGGYTVYVVTADMFNMGSINNGATTSGSYLYAFSPNGELKYQLQLNQVQ